MKKIISIATFIALIPCLLGCNKPSGTFKFNNYSITYDEGKGKENFSFFADTPFPHNEEELLAQVKESLISIRSPMIKTEDECIHFKQINVTNECVDIEGNPITNIGEVNHIDISESVSALTCNYGQSKGTFHFYETYNPRNDMKITFNIWKIVGSSYQHNYEIFEYGVRDESIVFNGGNLTINSKVVYQSRTVDTEPFERISAHLVLNYIKK